jgi:hypothetical protein
VVERVAFRPDIVDSILICPRESRKPSFKTLRGERNLVNCDVIRAQRALDSLFQGLQVPPFDPVGHVHVADLMKRVHAGVSSPRDHRRNPASITP